MNQTFENGVISYRSKTGAGKIKRPERLRMM